MPCGRPMSRRARCAAGCGRGLAPPLKAPLRATLSASRPSDARRHLSAATCGSRVTPGARHSRARRPRGSPSRVTRAVCGCAPGPHASAVLEEARALTCTVRGGARRAVAATGSCCKCPSRRHTVLWTGANSCVAVSPRAAGHGGLWPDAALTRGAGDAAPVRLDSVKAASDRRLQHGALYRHSPNHVYYMVATEPPTPCMATEMRGVFSAGYPTAMPSYCHPRRQASARYAGTT